MVESPRAFISGWGIRPSDIEDNGRQREHRYQPLDTAEEASFDQTSELAACVSQAPITGVPIVDLVGRWLKSRFGLNLTETFHEISLQRAYDPF